MLWYQLLGKELWQWRWTRIDQIRNDAQDHRSIPKQHRQNTRNYVKNPNKEKNHGVAWKSTLIKRLQEEEENLITALFNSPHCFVLFFNPNYCASHFIEKTRVTNCDISKLPLTRGLSFLYREDFRLDHIRCTSLRLGDVPLLYRSECSSRDSEWSSEHLNMPPSETPSSPTIACSMPLLWELTRFFSPRETLPEASPPSHWGWSSHPPNSHCNWAL